jgi:hypothetical protein
MPMTIDERNRLTEEIINAHRGVGRCSVCSAVVLATDLTLAVAFPHWLPGVPRTEPMCAGVGYPVRAIPASGG